jgi:hypothetical protein
LTKLEQLFFLTSILFKIFLAVSFFFGVWNVWLSPNGLQLAEGGDF